MVLCVASFSNLLQFCNTGERPKGPIASLIPRKRNLMLQKQARKLPNTHHLAGRKNRTIHTHDVQETTKRDTLLLAVQLELQPQLRFCQLH